MMIRGKLAEVRTHGVTRKHMSQSISPRRDRIARLTLRKNMNYCQLPAPMRRIYQRPEGFIVQHRNALVCPVPSAPVIMDDLDVVRSFCDASVYESLCLLRSGNRGDRWASHLRRMPTWDGCTDARGSHIRNIRAIFRFHFLY